MTTFAPRTETVQAWGGRFDLRFQVAGSGPALVYLHPAGGMFWDDFLQGLADRFTVYAPVFPGTDPVDTMSIHQVDDIFDVVLAYEGALRSLGLQGAPAIGASFGGMLAAELAASFPDLFGRLMLLDPAGLWSESAPWDLSFMSAPPESIPGLLFNNPDAADRSGCSHHRVRSGH
jgi:pimeloyl-ACP methyl ester carboxylesterase